MGTVVGVWWGGGRGRQTQGERIRERELEHKMDRGRSLAPEEN